MYFHSPQTARISRRTLLRNTSLLALSGAVPEALAMQAQSVSAKTGTIVAPNLYESIGVRPIVNCKGTFTIITGSQTLPEVKRAMDEASHAYVQMDELMLAVSQRLAEISGAEWGIVTAGCCAAITHATAACIAGNDPERMQRMPDLRGLKDTVVIPKYSRNPYDHAVRMLGVRMVEVDSEQEFTHALNAQTAMVYILSSPAAERGPLGIENICRIANAKGVPVFVDAAAEEPTFRPNIHLARGATFVGYSGGKCMRGPQASGLLLGRKDLVQAAWCNSAPHHAFGRSLKAGKEEIMGMLTAVEMWDKRDHKAEWDAWMSWLNSIAAAVTKVPGVTTEYIQPVDLSNHAPQLRIRWDGRQLGITGTEVVDLLANGNPRIFLASGNGIRPDAMASSVAIMPYMMMPEDHKIAAEALYAALSMPPKFSDPVVPQGSPADVAGVWQVTIAYLTSASPHRFFVEQKGNSLTGVHESETLSSSFTGSIHAGEVRIASVHPIQGTVVEYTFLGTVEGGAMNGKVTLGEYGEASWSATRV